MAREKVSSTSLPSATRYQVSFANSSRCSSSRRHQVALSGEEIGEAMMLAPFIFAMSVTPIIEVTNGDAGSEGVRSAWFRLGCGECGTFSGEVLQRAGHGVRDAGIGPVEDPGCLGRHASEAVPIGLSDRCLEDQFGAHFLFSYAYSFGPSVVS